MYILKVFQIYCLKGFWSWGTAGRSMRHSQEEEKKNYFQTVVFLRLLVQLKLVTDYLDCLKNFQMMNSNCSGRRKCSAVYSDSVRLETKSPKLINCGVTDDPWRDVTRGHFKVSVIDTFPTECVFVFLCDDTFTFTRFQ